MNSYLGTDSGSQTESGGQRYGPNLSPLQRSAEAKLETDTDDVRLQMSLTGL